MHPEVRQNGPGELPAVRNGARAAHHRRAGGTELRAGRYDAPPVDRFGVYAAGFRACNEWARAATGIAASHSAGRQAWLEFALSTPVVWAGRPFFVRAWASIRNRSLDMFSLIALGMGSA
jgi:Cu+-exporting ATPase